jgi:hypothetical protein
MSRPPMLGLDKPRPPLRSNPVLFRVWLLVVDPCHSSTSSGLSIGPPQQLSSSLYLYVPDTMYLYYTRGNSKKFCCGLAISYFFAYTGMEYNLLRIIQSSTLRIHTCSAYMSTYTVMHFFVARSISGFVLNANSFSITRAILTGF